MFLVGLQRGVGGESLIAYGGNILLRPYGPALYSVLHLPQIYIRRCIVEVAVSYHFLNAVISGLYRSLDISVFNSLQPISVVAYMGRKQKLCYSCSRDLPIPGEETPEYWLEHLRDWGKRELPHIPPIPPSSAGSQRDRLEAEIAAEETEITFLRAKIIALEESIWKKRACLAPVRRLYPELLSKIFVYLDDGEDDMRSRSFCFPTQTLDHPITTVCRHWREVAFSTASLFTSIQITNEFDGFWDIGNLFDEASEDIPPNNHTGISKKRVKALERLERWLLLSQKAPLAIEFEYCRQQASPSDDLVLEWNCILKHVYRWRKIRLSSDQGIYIDLLRHSGITAEQLQEFIFYADIAFAPPPESGPPSDMTKLPLHLPRLTSLTTHVKNLTFLLCNAPILDHLCIFLNHLTVENIECINGSFPNISKLTLHTARGPVIQTSDHTPNSHGMKQFCLNHLTEIQIFYSDALNSVRLSVFSNCHSLAKLKMKLFALTSLPKPSGCLKSVTSLHLSCQQTDGEQGHHGEYPENSPHFFSSFPGLLNLHVVAPYRYYNSSWGYNLTEPQERELLGFDHIIDSLAPKDRCPRLTTLLFESAVFQSDKLLNLSATYSGRLLISLKECHNWPDVDSLDEANLRSAFEEAGNKNTDHEEYRPFGKLIFD